MTYAQTPNTSGQGKAVPLPPGLKKWNWGAFFYGWLWGLFNRTYIALLTLVPFVNIIMAFVLGAKGTEWAWQNKQWQSEEHFHKVQKNWAIAALIGFVISILLTIAVIAAGGAASTSQQ